MNPDKFKGIIIGLALGDALGAPHEFKSPTPLKYTGKLEHIISRYNRFTKETTTFPIGIVTDDTEMTMVLLRSIVAHKTYSSTDVILKYEQWAKGAKMMGKNTRALFKGVTTVKGYQNRYNKIFGTPMTEWTQSNGSLMRCSPFVLFSEYDNLIIDTKLSNPHPINIECGMLYIYLMRYLTFYDNPPEIDSLFNYAQEPQIMQVLSDVKNKVVRDISLKSVKGWVITAFYCALWSIYHISTATEAYKYFIDQLGDTDTNAAILGALYGSKYGFNGLYLEQKDNIDLLFKVNSGVLGDLDTIISELNIIK